MQLCVCHEWVSHLLPLGRGHEIRQTVTSRAGCQRSFPEGARHTAVQPGLETGPISQPNRKSQTWTAASSLERLSKHLAPMLSLTKELEGSHTSSTGRISPTVSRPCLCHQSVSEWSCPYNGQQVNSHLERSKGAAGRERGQREIDR